jgi:hypothetical protein
MSSSANEEPQPAVAATSGDASGAIRGARIAALTADLARRRVANLRYAAKRAAIGLALAAGIGLVGYGVDRLDGAWWPLWYVGLALLLVLLPSVQIFLELSRLPFAIAPLRRELELLEREQTEVAQAMRLAASGAPFALFLRSFGVEAAGARVFDEKSHTMAEMTTQAQIMTGGVFTPSSMDYFPPEVADRSGAWNTQWIVLQALSDRLPTVLLGNARLPRSNPVPSPKHPINEAMVVTEDWWDIFLRLADRAAVVVMLLEEGSPSLLRELSFLSQSAVKTIVVSRFSGVATAGATNPFLQHVDFADHASFKGDELARALDTLLAKG